MKNVVAAYLMRQAGPGEDPGIGVDGRQADDGGLQVKDRSGVDRPGVGTAFRASPFHKRRNDA
ncbi:hypothetical protein D1872_294260 [compost metagenome]